MQLNDTHPAMAVAELMRLLVDEHRLDWDEAWDITSKTMAYTNHTLLPEALEKWPLAAVRGGLCPGTWKSSTRSTVASWTRSAERSPRRGRVAGSRSSTKAGQYVRMAISPAWAAMPSTAWQSSTPSFLKHTVLKDFYDLWPEKFSNKTNGVTPRRFMVLSNPR